MPENWVAVAAWEEGDPAQAFLAPEQKLSALTSSYQGDVFYLTQDGRVYLSTLKQDASGMTGRLQELALPCQFVVDIACSLTHTVFVTDRGRVLQAELSTMGKVEELDVRTKTLFCQHGTAKEGERFIIREVSSSITNILFLTEDGGVWLMEYNRSQACEPIEEFKGKCGLKTACGLDFNIVLLQDDPDMNSSNIPDDSGSDSGSLMKGESATRRRRISKTQSVGSRDSMDLTVRVSSCSLCREQISLSKGDSFSEKREEDSDVFTESDKSSSNTLAGVYWQKADNIVRQSAMFLNADAAKHFLSKQLSWVSASTEAEVPLTVEETKEVIKDNVTQVANLVIEGVKNLGDKVNKISRRWSGNSQENAEPESQKTVAEESGETCSLRDWERLSSDISPLQTRFGTTGRKVSQNRRNWRKHGSSSLSLDSLVKVLTNSSEFWGEPNKSEHLIKAGQSILATSVWTWGQGMEGQLGLSDTIARDRPIFIRSLQGIGASKIVTGRRHCLVLTIDGRVFAWGANNKGQVCPSENSPVISTPREIALPFRATVRDIAAGGDYSLLLTTKGDVFFMGYSIATQKPALMLLNLPVPGPGAAVSTCSRVWASGSVSVSCFELAPFNEWIEFITSEQFYLRSCLTVVEAIVKPLGAVTGPANPVSNARRELFDLYTKMVSLIALNVHSLSEMGSSDKNSQAFAVVRWLDDYLSIYRLYCRAFCNNLVVNALNLNKMESALVEKAWPGVWDATEDAKSRKTSNTLQVVMVEPISRPKEYSFHLTKLAEVRGGCAVLLHTAKKFEDAAAAMATECQDAEYTKLFWESCSSKLVDALRTPERRLIRESRASPMNLHNAGRFSSNWFILLNDVFVHVGYSGHTTYQLNTIWVEPLPDCENDKIKNAFTLTMPEDLLTVSCPTAAGKLEWLAALQAAIRNSLKISTEDFSLSRNSLPLARYATYTFTKTPTYKDATYNGLWLCGKIHGDGELRWPDGRFYQGHFRQNQQYGFGTLETVTPEGVTVYEGNWRDGKMNGHGIMRYANGDFYEGYFQDNLPHGHGTMKRGHFMTSAADIYVGQWEAGQRYGYGVMDDIIAGEKYMGMWQGDVKHGNAVLVTLDGLYMEGCFVNNKMTGQCLMLLEDGTSYEGEVASTGILGGRGILKLPNGDSLQGSFHGSWAAGVKVNATLTKAMIASSHSSEKPPTPSASSTFGQLSVPASRKWETLFRHCSHTLGISAFPSRWKDEDSATAWENIAVIINQAKQLEFSKNGRRLKNPSNVRRESNAVKKEKTVEIPEILERIPDVGKAPITTADYAYIKTYLSKAFDCSIHPIGCLANQIADVYRATYIGVGAHARLLPHAVAEVRSFVNRIYLLVRLLFPALPPEDSHIVISEDDTPDQDTLVSASTLLLPLLLPRIYPPLFTLYALHNAKQDDLYWDRLSKWNRQSDKALMNFVGVSPKFISDNEDNFAEAIESLQQLSTTFSPLEKLAVLQQTFGQITTSVQGKLGPDYLWNMDDLFPVFQFVVVRARIRHLGSEINLVEDLLERHIQYGELDIMFTTLKACYFQIQHEKMTLS